MDEQKPQGAPPEGQAGGQAGAPADDGGQEAPQRPPTGDRFHGISREEVIRRFSELEDRANQSHAENQQLRDFFGRVRMYFKADGDNIALNDDYIMEYLKSTGKLPVHDKQKPTQTPPEGEDNFMDRFQEDPQKSLRDIIREELQGFRKEALEPLQSTVIQDRHQAWISNVTDRHPEFPQWRQKVAEFVKNHNWPVNSAQDLEKAFLHTRLEHGEYIPKSQHDSYVNDLRSTMQTLVPGAQFGGPRVSEDELTPEQLIGVNPLGNQKVDGAVQALFGKTALAPYSNRSR